MSACTSPSEIAVQNQTETVGLSRAQAQTHQRAAWRRYRNSEEAQRLRDMLDANLIVVGDDAMPISSQLHWEQDTPQPDAGYPVFISLHGGGAFTPGENNEQWDIQQRRYPAVQGLYICPRSPRNTWDHWHETHMFTLIDQLVRALLLRDDIDPDRIYLLGYCSGGNGVYQLGPILADRWAAVSATKAIHEGAPLANLRNCPIDLQWGEADPDTIDRPGLNRQNASTLYALHQADRDGYTFREIEHWRQGRFVNDKSTVGWLARFTRNPYPDRIVWEQNGDVRQSSNPIQHQFYYLAINEAEQFNPASPSRITAQIDRATNTLHLQVTGHNEIKLRLNDHMLNLDQPITITLNGQTAFQGQVTRQQETQTQTLQERGDPRYIFPVELTLPVPAETQKNGVRPRFDTPPFRYSAPACPHPAWPRDGTPLESHDPQPDDRLAKKFRGSQRSRSDTVPRPRPRITSTFGVNGYDHPGEQASRRCCILLFWASLLGLGYLNGTKTTLAKISRPDIRFVFSAILCIAYANFGHRL